MTTQQSYPYRCYPTAEQRQQLAIDSFVVGKDGSREKVMAKHKAWLKSPPELRAALPELGGKTLGGWYMPKACHGDVLVGLANQ